MFTLQTSSMTSVTRTPYHSCVVAPTSLNIRSAISIPKLPNGKLFKEIKRANNLIFKKNNTKTLPLLENTTNDGTQEIRHNDSATISTSTILKLHVIMEAVLDRIEMHQNIGEQRQNWNSLLLNSLNMVTLTAATMAGLAAAGGSILPLNISATLLFSAATGILMIMNKIQPSQLVEEQRNAVRKFKQLQNKLQMTLTLRNITEKDVEDAMEKVLALDRAYPLPLLGAMLDKFPETLKPAVWWPSKKSSSSSMQHGLNKEGTNGWTKELEEEMRDIVGAIERRDIQDYVRLGNKALKLNKALAKTGPILMGIAALGSALASTGAPWGGFVAAVAGSLASVVSTLEHGGQVGMVFEMYRNCAGFFTLIEETVESNLEEEDFGRRENGELFEMKMALNLGRSLSELRDFAAKSSSSCVSEEGSTAKAEFASKLF